MMKTDVLAATSSAELIRVPPSAIIIVIFGGAGDLTRRRLIPSLFDLHRAGRMPAKFAILALDHVPFRDADLRSHFLDGAKKFSRDKQVKAKDWEDFSRNVTYQQGDFQNPTTYAALAATCEQLDRKWKLKAGHLHLRPVEVRFIYRDSFAVPSPDAYETLLSDVMNCDATLFMRADQIEAAWRFLMPVLDTWAAASPKGFPNYAAGEWGPKTAGELLARAGHAWSSIA
jgi:glucose-6-phosphate 1-dehydrogenase